MPRELNKLNLACTPPSAVFYCHRIGVVFLLVLGGCASVKVTDGRDVSPQKSTSPSRQVAPLPQNALPPSEQVSAAAPAGTRRGAYYKDDGPAEQIPEGLLDIPDAEPKIEPLASGPRRPYTIFGKNYTPITDDRRFVQRGMGSWYGKKFHGQRTASGEIYDMYKMTAAHPTLPIPSYARVTNLRNGKQIVVRINDRGPFHSGRIIDLSYTAALKLGYIGSGSAELEVERILPEGIILTNAAKNRKAQASAPLLATADKADSMSPAANAASDRMSAADINGFYLQFGAYAQPDNAQAMLQRLLSGWPSDLPAPVVVQNGAYYRLHSGPFASQEAARRAAGELKANSAVQITVVQK